MDSERGGGSSQAGATSTSNNNRVIALNSYTPPLTVAQGLLAYLTERPQQTAW